MAAAKIEDTSVYLDCSNITERDYFMLLTCGTVSRTALSEKVLIRYLVSKCSLLLTVMKLNCPVFVIVLNVLDFVQSGFHFAVTF